VSEIFRVAVQFSAGVYWEISLFSLSHKQTESNFNWNCGHQKNRKKQPSPSQRPTNPKRNIVDTFCHASGMFGHNARLGLAIPYIWEMDGAKGACGKWTRDFSIGPECPGRNTYCPGHWGGPLPCGGLSSSPSVGREGPVEDPFTWRTGFWGGVSLGEAKGGVVEILKRPAKPFRKNNKLNK